MAPPGERTGGDGREAGRHVNWRRSVSIIDLHFLHAERALSTMARRPSLPAWLLAVVLAGTLGLAARAQGPGRDDDTQPPTFRTEANYVRVDVFATRDGTPVTDLRPEDFEILDEGVPQDIAQFEYIQIRGNVPQESRREPGTVAESRQMLQDPRARVFVLFLDTRHVGAANSRTVSAPLVDTLDDLIGVDDLVGVMTSDMSAADVTFARKTISLQSMLERDWWGQRDRLQSDDPVEQQYELCYPPTDQEVSSGRTVSRVAEELIERRRETMTLDALEDLVRFLRGVREERKAIILISEGWRLFQPNMALLNQGRAPQIPGPGFDPQTGRVTIQELTTERDPRSECDRDSLSLAMADTETQFRFMLDEANRANASFYPVDPSGLAVFDSPIGPDRPRSPEEDRARMRDRQITLRTLADLTDGLAVVNTNNVAGSLQRVVDDLSSYYLLGYYASGVEMDGTFHEVRVRVRRPGVDVRARRGYLAPSPEEVLAAAPDDPGDAPSAVELAEKRALDTALGSLARYSREMPLRVQVAAGWAAGRDPTFWVVGEVGRDAEWTGGADVDVELVDPDGETVTGGKTSLEAGTRNFELALAPDEPLAPGDYRVRVRARAARAGSLPTGDLVTVSLPAAPAGVGARFLRRGPVTGNRDVATADLRFRRNERLRVEVPGQGVTAATARLLDRTGQALAVPVTAALSDDGDWVRAELALSPLAVGDYVIEISMDPAATGQAGADRFWAGFRVIP